MKKLSLLLLFIAFLINACRKDPIKGLDYYAYTEKSDNTTFKATTSSAGFRSPATKDTLYIFANYSNEHLIIRIIPKGLGVYQSPNIDAVYFTDIGGDVWGQTYHLNSDPGNIVNITNFDQNIVQGSFDLTFKENRRNLGGVPSVITLSRGRFRSQISNSKTDFEWLFKQI